ncbi:MAG TPA: transposase [Candidatus Eremiobacteraceae bacterium]|nr:transposase [Candidatus Eremiobacteraceae bacterium]
MRHARTPTRLETVDYRQDRTYAVTFCVARRRPVFANPLFASVAVECLRHFRQSELYYLYAYAVMFDHVHMVLRVIKPRVHLSKVIAVVRSCITSKVRRSIAHFAWQRGYYERIVRNADECRETVEYVLANPRRANLVKDREQYAFSGILDRWR